MTGMKHTCDAIGSFSIIPNWLRTEVKLYFMILKSSSVDNNENLC